MYNQNNLNYTPFFFYNKKKNFKNTDRDTKFRKRTNETDIFFKHYIK